jgi:hypothetical protein
MAGNLCSQISKKIQNLSNPALPKRTVPRRNSFLSRVTLDQVEVDRKLSFRAQGIARLPEEKSEEMLARHEDLRAGVGC